MLSFLFNFISSPAVASSPIKRTHPYPKTYISILRNHPFHYPDAGLSKFPVLDPIKNKNDVPDNPTVQNNIEQYIGKGDKITHGTESDIIKRSITPSLTKVDRYYDPVQFGVYDENGMELMQQVNLPLAQQHLIHGNPPLPNPESVLPPMKWNTWLRDRGVAIMADNTNEFSWAATKPTKGLGLRQGGANAGQYSIEVDIDWQKLAGIKGFETHMIGVGRYGMPASRMFGDEEVNMNSEIWGGGGNTAFHMVFWYGEETLLNGKLNIIAGRMSLVWEYGNSPLYCNFMNNAFCGNPKGSTDSYTRSSYPATSWGTRIRGRPRDDLYIQIGLYFPERSAYVYGLNRSGFRFNGAQLSGVNVPFEMGWEPRFTEEQLPGHYKIGGEIDTSRHYLGVYNPPNAAHAASAAMYTPDGELVPGTGKLRHQGWAAWVLIDQMLLRHHTKDSMEGGLVAFAVAYWNKPDIALRGKLYSFGLVDTGLIPGRPLDTFGVAYSYTGTDKYTRRAQEFQMAHGLNYANGDPYWASHGDHGGPLMWGAYGVQRWGTTIEATYRFHVSPGVTFAPDFQYFMNPGLQKRLKDAQMIGFKSHVQLF